MPYLDHAATTPMTAAAVDAMTEQLRRLGNPSSLHAAGRAQRRVVEEAREQVAEILGAAPAEVVFTSGGTESDNLAVKGLYWSRRAADPRRTRILAGATEHHAVVDTVEWLAQAQGAEATWLPVDGDGVLAPQTLADAIAADPGGIALVSVMWANNEVGTIAPIPELAAVAREYGLAFHTDAVQAAGTVALDFTASGVDAMSVTGHKLGGPVGAGALLLRRDATPVPVLHGGGQERDVRSGTVDAAGIVGFTVALAAAAADREVAAARIAALRDDLVGRIVAAVPDAVPTLTGDPPRLPGIAHLAFPGCEGDALLMLLDAAGVECSTGSACSAGVARPSHVLAALGCPDDLARGSLRFSLGRTSTPSDVDAAVAAIGPAVERARTAGAQLAGVR